MGRPNRRSELIRYRQFLRDHLAEIVAGWDSTMHPDFGLTDQDAADEMDALEKKLRDPPKTTLMVTVSTRPDDTSDGESDSGRYCLGLRFCRSDGVRHVEDLLIKQVRERYPEWRNVKPKEIRRRLVFTVWIVPADPTKRGGWPIYDGPTGYWY